MADHTRVCPGVRSVAEWDLAEPGGQMGGRRRPTLTMGR